MNLGALCSGVSLTKSVDSNGSNDSEADAQITTPPVVLTPYDKIEGYYVGKIGGIMVYQEEWYIARLLSDKTYEAKGCRASISPPWGYIPFDVSPAGTGYVLNGTDIQFTSVTLPNVDSFSPAGVWDEANSKIALINSLGAAGPTLTRNATLSAFPPCPWR